MLLGVGPNLTKSETVAALNLLSRVKGVTILNEACHSGHWTDVASRAGVGRDALVECASQADEKAWNWFSGSGHCRCPLFAIAWTRDTTVHPDGRVSQHITRIEEELDLVPLLSTIRIN